MMETSTNLEMATGTFKKSSTSDNQETELKVRRSVHLPNEIWLKIMNYMITKDIFRSFDLVNKHFNKLTLDINYLQVKNIGLEGIPQNTMLS